MADDKTKAILSLILNIVFPGVGTFLINKTKTAVIQIVLYILGVILSFILIGLPIVLIVWLWAVILSVIELKKAL